MSRWLRTKHPSVYVRHQAACPAPEGRCRCEPSYFAQARSKTTGKIVKSRVVHNIDEAAGWLADFKRGRVGAPGSSKLTLKDVCEQFMAAAESGAVRPQRSTEGWSNITLDVYRSNLEVHVYPEYGNAEIDKLTVVDWQRFLDKLHRQGLAYNSIKVILAPVRSTYRWACAPARQLVAHNATVGLEMPANNEVKRTRFATPEEALELLAPLAPREKVIFALAFYAGMRRREIRPCRWDWIDFERGIIDVRESKSKAGIRIVPMAGPLRAILLEWRLASGNPDGDQLVAPGARGGMFGITNPLTKARAAWKDAGIDGIGLHECRHTYASFMIAAGVNAKAISQYMGHSSIQITFDRYGHLMPGNESEAAELLDAYLKQAVRS